MEGAKEACISKAGRVMGQLTLSLQGFILNNSLTNLQHRCLNGVDGVNGAVKILGIVKIL